MFVETMTGKELYCQYSQDCDKVFKKASYDFPEFRSAFLHRQRRGFPYSRIYEYTTPDTHNRYLYVLVANSKKELSKPHLYAYAFYTNKKGMTGLLGIINNGEMEFCTFLTRHFFERYGERALGITGVPWIEIAKMYIRKSYDMTIMENNEWLSNGREKYKPDEDAIQTAIWLEGDKKGLVFTNLYDSFIEWTTFISYDLLGDNQLDEIERQLGKLAA